MSLAKTLGNSVPSDDFPINLGRSLLSGVRKYLVKINERQSSKFLPHRSPSREPAELFYHHLAQHNCKSQLFDNCDGRQEATTNLSSHRGR